MPQLRKQWTRQDAKTSKVCHHAMEAMLQVPPKTERQNSKMKAHPWWTNRLRVAPERQLKTSHDAAAGSALEKRALQPRATVLSASQRLWIHLN
jgi:hypothetical protein